MRTAIPRIAGALAVALGACAYSPKPTEPMERALRRADESARSAALAGFHAYLVGGDAAKAAARFDQALKMNPGEPYALMGKLLHERRASHPERALGWALTLCERAPRHPLASAGARYLLDIAGSAVPLDQEILFRGEQALQRGLEGDAAHLVRSAIAHIHSVRGEELQRQRAYDAMGVPDRLTLLGPFSAFHVLDFDAYTPPERTGSFAGPMNGPFGRIEPRSFVYRDARFDLEGEGDDGDVFILGVDLEVSEPAVHLVRAVGGSAYRVTLDGEPLIERRSFARALPTVLQQAVRLPSGKHRLVVKLLRGERGSSIALALPRADGRPSTVKFSESRGPAPRWDGASRVDAPLTFDTADSMRRALEPEVGPALAQYLAVRDGIGRDREGAKAMMLELQRGISGPALTSLRAELNLGDRTVPTRVARGRATRDLEATAESDPADLQALLVRAQVALDDGRPIEALGLVKSAKNADPHPGFPTFLAEARVNLALSVDAQADLSAVQALAAQPGLCDALSLRYDLARRRDATALADDLVKAQEQCPGSRQRTAEHLRLRGDLTGAAALYQQLLDRDPAQLAVVVALANLQLSQKKPEAAEATVRDAAALWPRSAPLARKLGDILELRGKAKDALAERERALTLDGGDLLLRRSVSRARTGAEPLQDRAIDGATAIKAHEESPGQEDTPLAYVLDAAAMEAYPDGSLVDRIHIIQKALDQGGVPEVAEVAIPNGAHVLSLRTIKPDGSVLEPESIEGKETVSLPGVQVGDYVEYEYLLAHPTRGPGQPGFTATNFYFQISNAPNNWSTYTVVAPKGSNMKADAHNLQLGKESVKVEGDKEVFFHEERRVAPFVPEPAGPPSATEYLPFVSVGAGAQGNDALVDELADAFADRAQLTVEIDQFAREAVGKKKGVDAVRALYAAVMARLQGRDSGLGQSASNSLAQDRGSRLWLLKAALESVGIPARVVVVRGFQADPAPYKFPNDNLLPFVGLYVELERAPPLWLDTQLRYGPFAQLPEQAADGKDAWILAEAGRSSRALKTPTREKQEEKRVSLELQLSAEGVLSGVGDERYFGRESAQLQEALEQMSPDQRDQALQSALSRYFGGAELSQLRLDMKREVGAPMTVHYEFKAPRFGRVEGDKMLLPPLTFPSQLGRRYVQLGSRRTPLFIDNTELTNTRAQVKLPRGWKIQDPIGGYQLRTRFGAFTRQERQAGDQLTIVETYRLDMARVAPKDYEPFTRFAGEIDLIQARDVVLAKQ